MNVDHRDPHDLPQAICALTRVIRELIAQKKNEFECSRSHLGLATKHDLAEMETRIMSAISDFATRQTAFNARIDTAIQGLEGDVATLNATIEKLQNTPGVITPEDQELLNQIEQRSDAIAAKLEALDALTPPAPPVG